MPRTQQTSTPVHAGLLDVLVVVALLGVALTSLALAMTEVASAPERAVICAGCVVVFGALWWWRRSRGASVGVTTALGVVALVTAFAGDNLLAMLPVFCVVLVLALDHGPAAAIVFAVAIVVVIALTMVLLTRHDPEYVITQVVATGAFLAFVVALALLLDAGARDNVLRQRLLDERDQANEELREANARLRHSLDAEKELVLARERARSARELHDGLGHRLTLIGMSLDFAERVRDSNLGRAWEEIATARQTAQEAMAEMRLWVRALNPVSVEGLQGVAALDAVADAFRGTGVDVRLEVTGDERPMPDDVLLFCHRFVQEGLTNALRHARARVVRIGLDHGAHQVRITLADDGAAGAVTGDLRRGFGLRSLADRARELGGTFDASTQEGGGVVLTAEIPTGPRSVAREEREGT